MSEARGDGKRLFAAVFLVAAVLVAPLTTSNENRTTVLLRALERGELTIDRDAGMTGDLAWVPNRASAAALELGGVVPSVVAGGGHFHAGVAPGLAVAVYPAYRLGRALGLAPLAMEALLALFGAALPLALGSLGVRRAVMTVARGTVTSSSERVLDDGMIAGATFGLGTIALAYGTRLWAHALVASLLAWVLALVLENDGTSGSRSRGRLALAGLLAGVAVATDYNVVIAVIAFSVLVAARHGVRGALPFALGGLAVAIALGVYHQRCFGSPLRTPYEFATARDVRAVYAQGHLGFTFPRPWILLELLVGSRRGILWTQPAVLLGVAGLVAAARRSRLHAYALGVVVLVLLQNASRVHDWHGGTCWGARYTIAAVPFALLGLPRARELAGRTSSWLLGVSVALALLGATTAFTFSVPLALERLVLLGPRTIGLARLVLGGGDHEATGGNALVAALALSIVLPVALGLVRPSVPLGARLTLAVTVWLFAAPFLRVVAHEGAPGGRRVEHAIGVEEQRANVAAAWHPAEVGHFLGWALKRDDLESVVIALDRLVAMEPDEPDLEEMLRLNRESLERQRRSLRRE